jgi:nitroimidazol reductase NimA-like FMN-containing flavoprotein (pyridoxamine 5'-phosphate oxidase superfamily)
VDGALAQLDRDTCLALLAAQPVGRLVFTQRALPDVLPVNYLLDGESVLIRLRSGSAPAVATRGSVVAFEVDNIDVPSQTGWSVTVVGRAHEIVEPRELRRVTSLGLVSWTGDQRDHFLSITVEKITGRRLFHPAQTVELPEAGAWRTPDPATATRAEP